MLSKSNCIWQVFWLLKALYLSQRKDFLFPKFIFRISGKKLLPDSVITLYGILIFMVVNFHVVLCSCRYFKRKFGKTAPRTACCMPFKARNHELFISKRKKSHPVLLHTYCLVNMNLGLCHLTVYVWFMNTFTIMCSKGSWSSTQFVNSFGICLKEHLVVLHSLWWYLQWLFWLMLLIDYEIDIVLFSSLT